MATAAACWGGCNSVSPGPGAAGAPQVVPTVPTSGPNGEPEALLWRRGGGACPAVESSIRPGMWAGPQPHLPLPYSPASCRPGRYRSHTCTFLSVKTCPTGTSEFLGFRFSSESYRQPENTPSPNCRCGRWPPGSRRRRPLGPAPPSTPNIGGDALGGPGRSRVSP